MLISYPATGAKGATGLAHDWSISAELVRRLPKTLIMAGGLTPDNVADAIRQVRPAVGDAHTILESRKDHVKVRKFVAGFRRARLTSARGQPFPPPVRRATT